MWGRGAAAPSLPPRLASRPWGPLPPGARPLPRRLPLALPGFPGPSQQQPAPPPPRLRPPAGRPGGSRCLGPAQGALHLWPEQPSPAEGRPLLGLSPCLQRLGARPSGSPLWGTPRSRWARRRVCVRCPGTPRRPLARGAPRCCSPGRSSPRAEPRERAEGVCAPPGEFLWPSRLALAPRWWLKIWLVTVMPLKIVVLLTTGSFLFCPAVSRGGLSRPALWGGSGEDTGILAGISQICLGWFKAFDEKKGKYCPLLNSARPASLNDLCF